MKIRRHSLLYNFIGDPETGITFRWGKTLDDDPSHAPWPELADISISNYCTNNCHFCYRDSSENGTFMSSKKYEYILNSLYNKEWGNIFEVALGGGEPSLHPNLTDILDITLERNIIANLTSNINFLNDVFVNKIKNKVRAIGLSVDSFYNIDEKLLKTIRNFGTKINLHFIITNSSIHIAYDILHGKYNNEMKLFDSILFLMFKPCGRGKKDDQLVFSKLLISFFKKMKAPDCNINIALDSCLVPLSLRYTDTNPVFIDACESGKFSVYIDENLNVSPCSFANNTHFTYNLEKYPFNEIWIEKFDLFRALQNNTCARKCELKKFCHGECYYYKNLNCHKAGYLK